MWPSDLELWTQAADRDCELLALEWSLDEGSSAHYCCLDCSLCQEGSVADEVMSYYAENEGSDLESKIRWDEVSASEAAHASADQSLPVASSAEDAFAYSSLVAVAWDCFVLAACVVVAAAVAAFQPSQ